MGQKVHPIGFRLGIYRTWPSRWFARRNYGDLVIEDIKIRSFLENHLDKAEVASIEIEKAGDNVRVIIHSGRPGAIIGKRGQEIDTLKQQLSKYLHKNNVEVAVQEVKKPELDATLIARNIAAQLEKRGSFKRAMKRAAQSAIRAGARGIKICCGGRLGGAEIARKEWVRVGSVPLHTLRSDVDYGFAEADTTYGKIGTKVWVCRGDFQNIR